MEDQEIKTSKKDLLDCIHNLMAILDSPLGRRRNTGWMVEEAVAIGKQIMKENGRGNYNTNEK